MISDEMIIQKAMQRDLLSFAQLKECKYQQKIFPGKTVLDILLEKGYLRKEQIEKISQAGENDDDDAFLSSEPKAAPESPMGVSDMLPSVEEMTLRPGGGRGTAPTNLVQPPPLPSESSSLPGIQEAPVPQKPKLPELPKTPMSTPFGKAAVLLKMVTKEQAYDALVAQATDSPDKKLGEIMVAKGYLTPDQVEKILARQKTRTMGCPKCEKKYQIVLYQAGRSYKCKTCQIELEDAKKVEKKQKKKLAEGQAPEKLQVMGLTQAIPSVSRGKTDIGSLGFREEGGAHKSAAPASYIPSEAETEVSTEAQLRDVGLEIPDAIPDFRRPQRRGSGRYGPIIFSVVAVVVISLLVYGVMGKRPSEEEEVTENSQASGQPEPVTEQSDPAEEDFKNLPPKVQGFKESDLRKELAAYQAYADQYPESSHHKEVAARIEEINTALARIEANKKLESEFSELRTTVEEYRDRDEFSKAMRTLKKFASKVEGTELEPKIAELERTISDKALQAWKAALEESRKLEKEGKFSDAISLLRGQGGKQPGEIQEKISARLKEVTENWEKHKRKWNDVAVRIIYEIYPFLKVRDYYSVRDAIAQIKKENSIFAQEISPWEEMLQDIEELWNKLQDRLKLQEGKAIAVKLDREVQRQREIKGRLKLKLKDDQIESLQIESDKGVAKVDIEWIEKETISDLLADDFRFDEENFSERATLTLFLFPWKGVKSIEESLSEVRTAGDDTTVRYREMVAYYLIGVVHYNINTKKAKSLEEPLKELSEHYRNTRAFEWNKERLTQELTAYEESDKKEAKTIKSLKKYLK